MNFRIGWDSRTPGTLKEHWARYVTGQPEGTCWNWQGSKDKDGYGKFCHDGKHLRAHRASYEIHKEPIPKGMMVCHTCDNPSCVNPEHLFLGDSKLNMVDMVHKNRGPLQKLTTTDVLKVRKLLDEGLGTEYIAVMYGVHVNTIRRIRNGLRWSHVQEAAA